ncbi:MAG: hypothetical protein L6Q37_06415 [Bdellovibrionaceae bacterium]|nr:hypothetical protein [Pseudobdellovibrionaceae bacterium]NUM60120.1 hypothetical protein [Pseudobdellovibrionaceae bacterium]
MAKIKQQYFRFDISLFLTLIRALFPHWNFFDKTAYSFHVQYRFYQGDSWKNISFDQVRKFHHLFINYQTNLALAKISIIEHFSRDVQELENREDKMFTSELADRVEALTSYRLLLDFLREEIKEELFNKKFFKGISNFEKTLFQFQVIATRLNHELVLYSSSNIALEIE